MTMNYGAMHKIIDCEALVELGHGEVDKTMEEQVAMVEPAKMETTREKQVGEIPSRLNMAPQQSRRPLVAKTPWQNKRPLEITRP
ncbi:hypothetical protein QQF64_035664 [Cirrhinus molitorella]|uniref:Uncharacterized protein n=1 Tax=Cirrhinus molitorella TaxID=172907 RepID=A0ABR3NGF1_9TELE